VAEHKNITDPNIHEPKGVATATSGTTYVANGSGSGTWGVSPVNLTGLVIERLVDGFSTATSQEPTGLDTTLQIEFGAGETSAPVTLDATGKVTINVTGTYRVKLGFAVGRIGSAGVASIYIRALIDGVQVGQSVHWTIGSAESYIPFTDEAWLTLTAGTEITYEIIKDSGNSGVDAGGLFQSNPTTAGWATNPSASIRVERFV
tara:strand:+ start:135 stop:746 length:612 start_codon:yes stop_codon:yes gene_type:complete